MPDLTDPGYYKGWLEHYIGGLVKKVDRHHLFLMAGGLSFSLLICLVPLVLIIFSILGMVLSKPTIVAEINNFIDKMIPYPHQSETIKSLLSSRVSDFTLYRSLAGWLGLGGMIIASSGLFSSMRTILNAIFQAKPQAVFVVGKIRDLGLVLLVLLYFLFSITVLPGISILFRYTDQLPLLKYLQLDTLENLLARLASLILVLFVFLVVYSYIPMTKIPKRAILISALSATCLWELAKYIFGFYIHHFVTLDRIYGTYALLIMAIFWIYYSSIVFIIGAIIGQLFRERLEMKAV